ncbi:MAG: S24 family peptidase [Rhodocyclaceae bacterium]|nr:S24 family peptidase [Rhodocyclaceae bacterium]
MKAHKPFPIAVRAEAAEPDAALAACSGAEPFALMVLGDSMAPEFVEGDIIVIEPEGLARDGSFVLAFHADEWIFRQLVHDPEEGWKLHPLNPNYPDIALSDLSAVRGVVIQKSKPGRRKATKHYLDE